MPRREISDRSRHTSDARTAFFYMATGVTPAMVMRLPEVGSQYLFGIYDAGGRSFDGGRIWQSSPHSFHKPGRSFGAQQDGHLGHGEF